MSGFNSVEEISKIIIEECALRAVLKAGKVCPYAGPSETCEDCTRDWVTVSNKILKVANIRKSSFENEKKKVNALKEQNSSLQEESNNLLSLVGRVAEGVQAGVKLFSMIKSMSSSNVEKGGENGTPDQSED